MSEWGKVNSAFYSVRLLDTVRSLWWLLSLFFKAESDGFLVYGSVWFLNVLYIMLASSCANVCLSGLADCVWCRRSTGQLSSLSPSTSVTWGQRQQEWLGGFSLFFCFYPLNEFFYCVCPSVYLVRKRKGRRKERGERRVSEYSRLLVRSPNACNGWGWVRFKLGCGIQSQLLLWYLTIGAISWFKF